MATLMLLFVTPYYYYCQFVVPIVSHCCVCWSLHKDLIVFTANMGGFSERERSQLTVRISTNSLALDLSTLFSYKK